MSKILIDEATVKLALEALTQWQYSFPQWWEWDEKDDKAITALREALAKPDFWEGYVPEPDSTCSNALRIQGKAYPRTCKKCGFGPCIGEPVKPAQQEPVVWLTEERYAKLHTAQRTWQGLTDEEIESLDCVYLNWLDYEQVEIKGDKEFARAIEAKLRSKNEDRN